METFMRIANLDGRLCLLTGGNGSAPAGAVATGQLLAIDVERASGGRFAGDPQEVYGRWAEFTSWAASAGRDADRRAARQQAVPVDLAALGSPAPRPAQVFGIGLNYSEHAAESGFAAPERPSVFTKFPSCITGPHGDIELPAGGHTDWEVELVAVIGERASKVAAADSWAHVAGLAVGQDVSERIIQLSGSPAQFSLGKSFPRFGPVGPWLVSVDEFASPDDLELGCTLNGNQVQHARTSQLIFTVPQIISALSAVLPLLPGDVIFTGTPAGVGLGRTPQQWLAPGDELVSYVEGIGELRHRFVAA
jgi:2-keto-4-pentenoate hydratase/2-oxohepta-3-ene-1,7-dioic acid hydratase in catechol pathway